MKFNQFITMAMRQAKDQTFRDIQNGRGIDVSYLVASRLSDVAWDWLNRNFHVTDDGQGYFIESRSNRGAE
jgi:hypothetical protein